MNEYNTLFQSLINTLYTASYRGDELKKTLWDTESLLTTIDPDVSNKK